MNKWRRNKQQDGTSAIEFTLILPVLLLVFYLIVTYGMGFLFLMSMNATTADITRSAVSVYTSMVEDKQSVAAGQAADIVAQTWFRNSAGFCPDMSAYIELDGTTTLRSCIAIDLPFAKLNVLDVEIPSIPDPMISRSVINLTAP